MTVSNKPGHRGEREVSRKTIARGVPGETGVTVVTTLVCYFYFACEAAGASSARHSLRPLISGAKFLPNLGRIAPRDRGVMMSLRGAKRRSNPLFYSRQHGLLRFARNDGIRLPVSWLSE